MKIHGSVYLVIGLSMAVISKIVNPERLIFFMYVGVFMALFGMVRLWLENRKKKQPKQNGSHWVTRHHKATPQQQTIRYYCRYCGYPLNPQYRYCLRCKGRW
jgi:hypothetical protein